MKIMQVGFGMIAASMSALPWLKKRMVLGQSEKVMFKTSNSTIMTRRKTKRNNAQSL